MSAMCIEPPCPRQAPVAFPNTSAIMALRGRPLAMQCPWPRWVLVIQSEGSRARQAPTATASCPVERWTNPGSFPSAKSLATASSKDRMRSISS
jgi:hypothetical protein